MPSSLRRLETALSISPPTSQLPGSSKSSPTERLPARARPEEDDVLELDPPWMVTSLVCSTVIRPTSGARRTKKTDCAWASPAPMHRLATASKPINAPSPRS